MIRTLHVRALNRCIAAIDLVAVGVDGGPTAHGALEEKQLGRVFHASCSASWHCAVHAVAAPLAPLALQRAGPVQTFTWPSDMSAPYGVLSMPSARSTMSWAAMASTSTSIVGSRDGPCHYSAAVGARDVGSRFQGSLTRGFAKAASAGGKGGEIMGVMKSTGILLRNAEVQEEIDYFIMNFTVSCLRHRRYFPPIF